jgi:hypothetical protein
MLRDSEPLRAIASLSALALLVHSWFLQRRYTKSKSTLAFFALVLSVPAMGALWLALNVVRFYSYPAESASRFYETVVRLQDIILDCAQTIGIVVFFWAAAATAVFLGGRISARYSKGKRIWWNTPLKGTWMYGSPIGAAISALIASGLLRWMLIISAALGVIFAVIFRFRRRAGEI